MVQEAAFSLVIRYTARREILVRVVVRLLKKLNSEAGGHLSVHAAKDNQNIRMDGGKRGCYYPRKLF